MKQLLKLTRGRLITSANKRTASLTTKSSPAKADSFLASDWGNGPCAARFHSALYSYYRGDYFQALPEFERLAERFRRQGDGARFVECSVYILRLHAEHENFAKVSEVESDIQRYFAKADLSQIGAKLLSRMPSSA